MEENRIMNSEIEENGIVENESTEEVGKTEAKGGGFKRLVVGGLIVGGSYLLVKKVIIPVAGKVKNAAVKLFGKKAKPTKRVDDEFPEDIETNLDHEDSDVE